MQKKIKLLVTARDPASANDIKQVLPLFIKDGRFIVRIIAQEPAYSIFLDAGIVHSVFIADVIDEVDGNSNYKKIEKVLKGVLSEFNPSCLLTGISGPGYGIDEIALRGVDNFDKNIKTFSIQSYWGDVNLSCNVLPDTIFVLDKFAAKITKENFPNTEIVITGSIQSHVYDTFDCDKERALFRQRFDCDTLIIALFGQPLFRYRWYKDTVKFFIDSVHNFPQDVTIVYKPHPKEKKESIDWVASNLNKCDYMAEKNSSVLSVIAGSDIASSLFSTVGYDLQNLLYRSKNPFSIPMYLFYDDDCVKWYKENCFLDEIPLSKNGMSILVTEKEEIDLHIFSALTKQKREICSRNIKIFFESLNKNPQDVIVQKLLNDLG